MPDELYVRVPDDLARDLDEEGIEEVEQVRSLDWLSQSAPIAVSVVGVAANLTTVLLAKDSIARFAQRLASWAAGRTRTAPGSVLTIRFDAQGPDEGSRSSIVAEVSAAGALSEADIARWTSFLAAAFTDRRDATS